MRDMSHEAPSNIAASMEMFYINTIPYGSHQPTIAIEHTNMTSLSVQFLFNSN